MSDISYTYETHNISTINAIEKRLYILRLDFCLSKWGLLQ